MITVTFTADNFWGLREQMLGFITIGVPPVERVERSPKRGRPPKAPTLDPEAVLGAIKDAVEDAFPLPEEEAVEAPPVEPVEEEEEGEVDYAEMVATANANQNALEALANEKLKAEVIESLHGLFTSGKVKVVRHVLNTYGNGAKSFPEIDASAFPAIKEALDRGEAA